MKPSTQCRPQPRKRRRNSQEERDYEISVVAERLIQLDIVARINNLPQPFRNPKAHILPNGIDVVPPTWQVGVFNRDENGELHLHLSPLAFKRIISRYNDQVDNVRNRIKNHEIHYMEIFLYVNICSYVSFYIRNNFFGGNKRLSLVVQTTETDVGYMFNEIGGGNESSHRQEETGCEENYGEHDYNTSEVPIHDFSHPNYHQNGGDENKADWNFRDDDQKLLCIYRVFKNNHILSFNLFTSVMHEQQLYISLPVIFELMLEQHQNQMRSAGLTL